MPSPGMHILLPLKQHIRVFLNTHISILSFELPYNAQPTAVQRVFSLNSPLERSTAKRGGVSVFLVLLREAQILSSAQHIKGLMVFEFPNNLQPTTYNVILCFFSL
jgi:hypothetical protein